MNKITCFPKGEKHQSVLYFRHIVKDGSSVDSKASRNISEGEDLNNEDKTFLNNVLLPFHFRPCEQVYTALFIEFPAPVT